MPVELYLVDKLKERIQLAREIDTAQHRVRKEKHERSWLKETAEAMEVELDSDFARSVLRSCHHHLLLVIIFPIFHLN